MRDIITTGYTDTNGVCVTGYTGNAGGVMDVIGVSDATFSNIRRVIDADYIQTTMVQSSHGTGSISERTLRMSTDGEDYALVYFGTKPSSTIINREIKVGGVVEFDLLGYTGDWKLRLDGTTSKEVLSTQSTATAGLIREDCHVKIVNDGRTIPIYIDDTLVYTHYNQSSETRTCLFRLETDAEVTVKNWLTYTDYNVSFSDSGLDSETNTNWFIQSTTTQTRTSTGMVLTGSTGGLYAWLNKFGTPIGQAESYVLDWSGDFCFEFELVEYTGTVYCAMYNPQAVGGYVRYQLTSDGKYTFTKDGNDFTVYKGTEVVYTTSMAMSEPLKIGFTGAQDSSMKVKDIVVVHTLLWRSVPTQVPNSLTLTSNKNILSLYHEDSCTLTCTVKDSNNDPIQNAGVTWFNGASRVGSGITNSSGKATFTYSSVGAGDVSLKAVVESLQETVTIEDCIFYDECTSNAKASAWTIPTGVTSTYDSDGWKVTANAYKQIKLTDKLTTDCSVEFTLTDFSNTSDMAVIIYAYTNGESTPNKKILTGGTTNTSNHVVFSSSLGHEIVKNVPYRIEYGSSTMKVYEEGTQIGSATNNIGFPTRFEFHTGANRWAIYKDIKVKPIS